MLLNARKYIYFTLLYFTLTPYGAPGLLSEPLNWLAPELVTYRITPYGAPGLRTEPLNWLPVE